MSDCVLEPGMRGIAGDGMTVRKMILLTLAGPSPMRPFDCLIEVCSQIKGF